MAVENKARTVDKSDGPDANKIAPLLLNHYDRHARTLPWRAMPGEAPTHPYRVWLSEIMLQQTSVAAAVPYFDRFVARWPDVDTLAAADDADVMAQWAGLGYYARARNLIRCARQVSEEMDGKFPATEEGLARLPGIGSYTSAAIAAIAFGKRAVVVDANVERVVARLFSIATPLPSARQEIREAADTITPPLRAGDFAQAMMDLGATVCIAKAPRCDACPLARHCTARKTGIAADLPVKLAKKTRPERTGRIWWVEKDGDVWLVTRPAQGMLAGMRALPDDGWNARTDGNGLPPIAGRWQRLDDEVTHVFSHFSIKLDLMLYRGTDFDMLPNQGQWWPVSRWKEAGLPTVFAKAAKIFEAARKN